MKKTGIIKITLSRHLWILALLTSNILVQSTLIIIVSNMHGDLSCTQVYSFLINPFNLLVPEYLRLVKFRGVFFIGLKWHRDYLLKSIYSHIPMFLYTRIPLYPYPPSSPIPQFLLPYCSSHTYNIHTFVRQAENP